ncbi:YeeE/YedE family protein [Paracrocinitomix mangrovi]|uniref:YeeE/YedE family protein n=1 Tax=Paracrocinitomix mangrovi TaxID=2862509 RepID=UPI001C8D16B1|nr:YeeE/YedE thiosulfate transporter family protein [Paracrocinitomix mangrovi]UKN03681.1 YeeE/YedE family protein [Paracrocinitomix mangrovi]
METIEKALLSPWPWYVVGPGIALVMLLFGYWGKSFGISSSNSTICSALGAGKVSSFFDFNWKEDRWRLMFLVGAVIGGFIVSNFMTSGEPIELSSKTVKELNELNISVNDPMVPTDLISWEALKSSTGILFMLVGGFLIGFGSRYAGGCTSGHAITGLSNLQFPSLIAVIGFFAGGLIMTYFIFPLIF